MKELWPQVNHGEKKNLWFTKHPLFLNAKKKTRK